METECVMEKLVKQEFCNVPLSASNIYALQHKICSIWARNSGKVQDQERTIGRLTKKY